MGEELGRGQYGIVYTCDSLMVKLHVVCREASDGRGVGPWSVRHCLHM